jgi:type IV fimbrial biogenesis protein FimT
MANQRVASSAEVFMAGLQMARGEAVKRNQRVEFILTDDTPTVASIDTTNTSTTGGNWIVRAGVTGGYTFIEGKSGAEGSGAATAAQSPIALTGSVKAVAYDGFGSPLFWNDTANAFVTPTTTAAFDFSNPNAGACAPTGPIRCLRIRISRGGQTRMCDPAVDATDTRSCGT